MGIDMVYSFHHFYYWVRGGLEYAQAYRAKALRRIGVDARFVFTTMFPDTAIWQVMEEMGFLDSEVLWLNGFLRIAESHRLPIHWNSSERLSVRRTLPFRERAVL